MGTTYSELLRIIANDSENIREKTERCATHKCPWGFTSKKYFRVALPRGHKCMEKQK